MATTPEGKVKLAVKKWLTDRRIYYYMPMSNGMGRVGCPDFLTCYNGLFLAIETKAPGKRANTTPNQKRELNWIANAGGIALVVDGVAQLDAYFGDPDDHRHPAQGAGHAPERPQPGADHHPHSQTLPL